MPCGNMKSTPNTCADCKHHHCTADYNKENCCSVCSGRCSKTLKKKSCSVYTCEFFEMDDFYSDFKEMLQD